MKNKIVYIDVDDTLANTREAIVKYYRSFTNDNSTSAYDYTNESPKYDVLTPLWDRERMTYAFKDPVFFALLKPFEGAIEGINYLIEKGYDVKICTAHRPDGQIIKRAWIMENFPMVKDIIFTKPFEGKNEYVGYAFIDDSIHNLIDNKSEIKLLFDKYGIIRYNNSIERKVKNWKEIREVL